MKWLNSERKFPLRRTATVLAAASFALLVSACGNNEEGTSANSAGDSVTITLLNSKGEILEAMETAAAKFHEENPSITVQIVQTPAGQSAYEKASALYASGNPTTITMQDTSDVPSFKERVLDLSNEKWVADARDGALDTSTVDGKVFGFPFAMEGYALIYSKPVLDKAVGGTFDPSTIVTTNDLDALLQKVEDSGVAGSFISAMDWSLGSHFMPIGFAAQADDAEGRAAFMSDLKAGTADLATNEAFNGLLDTFDVLKKYNLDKAAPLASPYEKGAEVMGKGQVGVWFMGNWTWPQLKTFDTADGQYGFLPVPLGNTQTEQTKVSVGVTKDLLVDKEKSTPQQQEAAKKFIDWMVYEESGQDFLVNQANVLPAFKNITLEMQDPLSKSLMAYMEEGKMLAFQGVPADYATNVGASMQKYLAGVSDRAGLVAETETYWKKQK